MKNIPAKHIFKINSTMPKDWQVEFRYISTLKGITIMRMGGHETTFDTTHKCSSMEELQRKWELL